MQLKGDRGQGAAAALFHRRCSLSLFLIDLVVISFFCYCVVVVAGLFLCFSTNPFSAEQGGRGGAQVALVHSGDLSLGGFAVLSSLALLVTGGGFLVAVLRLGRRSSGSLLALVAALGGGLLGRGRGLLMLLLRGALLVLLLLHVHLLLVVLLLLLLVVLLLAAASLLLPGEVASVGLLLRRGHDAVADVAGREAAGRARRRGAAGASCIRFGFGRKRREEKKK